MEESRLARITYQPVFRINRNRTDFRIASELDRRARLSGKDNADINVINLICESNDRNSIQHNVNGERRLETEMRSVGKKFPQNDDTFFLVDELPDLLQKLKQTQHVTLQFNE